MERRKKQNLVSGREKEREREREREREVIDNLTKQLEGVV